MSTLRNLYGSLGEAKSRELYEKYDSLWSIFEVAKTGRSKSVGGTVPEGIARDFVREFLPTEFKVKSGLIFDIGTRELSPQTDAIIYHGAPLLEYTDVVIVEKEKVRGVLEIKSWVAENDIFGSKTKRGPRNPNTGLIEDYKGKKRFLPSKAPYILFVFSLHSGSSSTNVIKRLLKVCDMHAIVSRRVPRIERSHTIKEEKIYNFNDSISRLIEWLRNLS